MAAEDQDYEPEYVIDDFTQDEITFLRNEGFLEEEHDDTFQEEEQAEDYSACVVIDGLPKVPEAKYAALSAFLRRLVTREDKETRKAQWPLASDDSLYMPMGSDGKTQGFAFVEYDAPTFADKAIANLNGRPFDKSHIMQVNRYTDIEEYRQMPEEYVDAEEKDFEAGVDTKEWLLDTLCRDQFLLRYARETEVYWTSPHSLPELDYDGARQKEGGRAWTDQDAIWSPQGTYLVTFHNRGLLLWGGRDFVELKRLAHDGVHKASFTQDERFLFTWSGYEYNEKPAGALIVWDLRTVGGKAKMVREFKQLVRERDDVDSQWSPDGRYLMRLDRDGTTKKELLKVYDASAPGMPLLNKRSIAVAGARDVVFPPAGKNIAAWWCPEGDSDTPAVVRLMSFPERKVIREKNLFMVVGCKMHWHPDGTFLCVQVTRHSKTKKTQFTQFQLFRVNERDVPIQMIEVKQKVHSFAWEPSGTRLSIVHGDGTRFNIDVYDMGRPGTAKPLKKFTMADKPFNTVCWSPTGTYAVLASLQLTAGKLEFWDMENQHMMNEDEHYRCNKIEWEKSGRIVTTSVFTATDAPGGGSDNGYALWTFQGNAIHSDTKPKFFKFSWRPRPETLLTEKQKTAVKKNLKRYIQRYQADDQRASKKRELEMLEERRKEHAAFMRWWSRLRREVYLDTTEDREELRDGARSDYEDEEYDEVVEEFEVVISEKTRIVKSFEE